MTLSPWPATTRERCVTRTFLPSLSPRKRTLITQDLDFGELVFREARPFAGVTCFACETTPTRLCASDLATFWRTILPISTSSSQWTAETSASPPSNVPCAYAYGRKRLRALAIIN